MKKAVKGLAVLIGSLAAIVLVLSVLTLYIARYKITDIDSSLSADGQYELFFQADGEPDWPFGYSHARIILKKGNEEILKHRFDVANDGGALCAENWKVEWKDEFVEVVISGEEQEDAVKAFFYDGHIG